MDFKNNEFRLCGGIFFTLILQCAKSGIKERKKFGCASNFTESDVFEELFKVAIPHYKIPSDKGNFGSIVSAYKSCNVEKTGRLPIHEAPYIADFDNKIKNNYQAALYDMNDFICLYLEGGAKANWLVKVLLELIKFDSTIKEENVFYIDKNIVLKKSNFVEINKVCLTNFLLSIWHFIVLHRQHNDIGKETYDKWCPKSSTSKNTREEFNNSIGQEIKREITIIPFENSEEIKTSEEALNAENGENPEETDFLNSKHTTVNNYAPVQNQKFLSINIMNGDINI